MNVERRARRRGLDSGRFRLAIVGTGPHGARNIASVVTGMQRRGFEIAPRAVPTYAALYETMSAGGCELAWAPPLVALDLWRCAAAAPLVRPIRRGQSSYYSVLLARGEPGSSIESHRGARVGWVAPESAAGYVVPRLGLRALGIDADAFFGTRRFLGTHGANLEALRRGAIDVAATYASLDQAKQSFALPPGATGSSVLAAYGPIPSDLLVVGRAVSPATQCALRDAFVSLGVAEVEVEGERGRLDGFEGAGVRHFDEIEAMGTRSHEEALRMFAPRPSQPPSATAAA